MGSGKSRNAEVAKRIYPIILEGERVCKGLVKDIDHPGELETMPVQDFVEEAMTGQSMPLQIKHQAGASPWLINEDGNMILWQKHEILTLVDEDGVDIEQCLLAFVIDMEKFTVSINLHVEEDPLGVAVLLQKYFYQAKMAIQQKAPWLKRI